MSDITTEVIKKGKKHLFVLAPFLTRLCGTATSEAKNQIFILKEYPFFSDISPSIDHQKKGNLGLGTKSDFQIFLDFV
jgi:hypothetical protein